MGDILGKRAGDPVDAVWWRSRRRSTFRQSIGGGLRANVVNVPADPEHVKLGMKVRLVTVPVGTDGAGVEAVGFGFEPMEES